MKTSVQMITPDFAKKLLEGNTDNRPIRRARVEEIKRIITAGEWKITHQGIALGVDMQILDGQHRLTAISESETPVEVMITYGLDKSAFSAIDRGLARTMADILSPKDNRGAKAVEMATTAFRIASRGRNRAIPAEIEDILSKKGCAFFKIIDAYSNSKTMSSAPLKVAAAAWAEINEQYALDTYIKCCREDFSSAPRICSAVFSRLARTSQQGKTTRQEEVFALGCSLYDEAKKDNTKVAIDDSSLYKSVMENWLAGMPIDKALRRKNDK